MASQYKERFVRDQPPRTAASGLLTVMATEDHVLVGARGSCIAAQHGHAKLGELLHLLRRTGVVSLYASVLGGEAEGDGELEFVQRLHHAVEPFVGVWLVRFRLALAGALSFVALLALLFL